MPSTPPSLPQPSEVEGGIIEKVLTLGVEQKQIRAEVGSCRTTNIQDGRVWSGERQGKREGICPEKTGSEEINGEFVCGSRVGEGGRVRERE